MTIDNKLVSALRDAIKLLELVQSRTKPWFSNIDDSLPIYKQALADYEAEKTAINTADIAEDRQKALEAFDAWEDDDEEAINTNCTKAEEELSLCGKTIRQALQQPEPARLMISITKDGD